MSKESSLKARFCKLKQKHTNNNYSFNYKWSKVLVSLGQNKNYMRLFKNQWFFYLFDITKSQYMGCVVCYGVQQEVEQNNAHHYKGLVMYNKEDGITIMTRHVFSKHSIVLGLYRVQRPIDANVSPNAQQFSKKWENPTPHSLNDYLALESFTRKLTFLINNSWRIYVYISPNGTINSISLKTFWLRKLVLWQIRKITFPNKQHVCNEVT